MGTGILYNGSSAGASVNSLVSSANNLFVGGTFITAGGISATNVAEWTGNSWSPLGPGLYQLNLIISGGHGNSVVGGQVDALAVLGNSLYATGSFNTNGAPAPLGSGGFASWNGNSWTVFDLGGSGAALAVSDSNVYVGGSFTIGTVSATNIAEWNGSAWSALGPGVSGPVNALTVSDDNLFVGGDFTTAGGISANNIAVWNRSSWSALAAGMNGNVFALAVPVSGLNLFAGGQFTTAGLMASSYIAEATAIVGTVQFTADRTNGTAPLAVQFTSPSVDSTSNSIVGWNWDFGDGSSSPSRDHLTFIQVLALLRLL